MSCIWKPLESIVQESQRQEFLNAIADGDLTTVQEFFLQPRFESIVRATNDWGENALHLACFWGHVEMVAYLLNHQGAVFSIDAAKTNNGSDLTALHIATIEGHLSIVQLLLEEHGANIEATTGTRYLRRTSWHLACRYGRVDIV
jgi:Ankyrin repeats (3 copies)/Ankyrin repeats (many copies)